MGVFILGNSKVLGVRYPKFFETYIRNVFLNNLNPICFTPFFVAVEQQQHQAHHGDKEVFHEVQN